MASTTQRNTMQDFTYHAPATLAEALTLKAEAGPDARFLAGGTDLFLAMEFTESPVGTVVDLKNISDLQGMEKLKDGGWRLGALALMAEIEAHGELRRDYPALADSAMVVGGPPVRNRATLGGNVCNASPAADTSTPLLALGADAVAASGSGERTMPLADLWSGPRATTLAAGEVLKEILLPSPAARSGSAFERLTRAAMDIALVNAAAAISVDEAGNIATGRCTLGAVGPTVLEVDGLEGALKGKGCTEETLEQVRKLARAAAKPIDDKRASAEYRRDMAGVLAARAVKRAHAMAVGAENGGAR